MPEEYPRSNQVIFESVIGSFPFTAPYKEADIDVVSVYVPDREEVYSPLVPGFGPHNKPTTSDQLFCDIELPSLGTKTIDLLVVNVVHFFNQLLKSSPNFLEMLFAVSSRHQLSKAGRVLSSNRGLFISQQAFARFMSAANGLSNSRNRKHKEMALRYFVYANQLHNLGTLQPNRTYPLINRIRQMSVEDVADRVRAFREISNKLVAPKQLQKEPNLLSINYLLKDLLELTWEKND